MRSKQYFTSIKNNPHEISTDPQSIKLWNTDSGAYSVDNGKRLYQ